MVPEDNPRTKGLKVQGSRFWLDMMKNFLNLRAASTGTNTPHAVVGITGGWMAICPSSFSALSTTHLPPFLLLPKLKSTESRLKRKFMGGKQIEALETGQFPLISPYTFWRSRKQRKKKWRQLLLLGLCSCLLFLSLRLTVEQLEQAFSSLVFSSTLLLAALLMEVAFGIGEVVGTQPQTHCLHSKHYSLHG